MTGPVIGVDIGGTYIKAGAVDERGRLGRYATIPTPSGEQGGHVVLEAALWLIRRISGDDAPEAVGLAVPGIVDDSLGVARWSANLRWRDFPVGEHAQRALGCPVIISQDVRAAGIAEHRQGASQEARNSVFVSLGTGIGAALILEDQLYSAAGYAGELGHIDVGNDLECNCGGRGCLEAIASASALARRYADATGVQAGGGREVADNVRAGDEVAQRLWDEATDALAYGVTALASLLAPDTVVIGGGLALAGDLLCVPIRQGVQRRLIFQRSPRIVTASLGERAGCVGAGLLAWDSVRSADPAV